MKSILTEEQMAQVRELANECPIFSMGNNNPRTAERQTIYGDVLDWVRDQIGYKDHFIATMIIGHWVCAMDARQLTRTISQDNITRAEKVLVDNGIDEDEADCVLQAIGYTLLDEELYPEK